jgi:hypothetical protein
MRSLAITKQIYKDARSKDAKYINGQATTNKINKEYM